MKGIVFVKFGEFVESLWGENFWDELLLEANLESEGVYTSAGTYSDDELFALIGLIVDKKAISAKDAQYAFGKWVFKELLAMAPKDAHQFTTVFDFLRAVQNIIHVEVKKLNPDALLPEFEFIEQTDRIFKFIYLSPRNLFFFCEGLIQGLSEYLNQPVSVSLNECLYKGEQCCEFEVALV